MSTPTLSAPTTLRHARILGLGGYRPERVVTNEEILQFIESSDEWIQTRSGIKARRFAGEDETIIGMSVDAGRQALQAAGVSAEEIGAVIVWQVVDCAEAVYNVDDYESYVHIQSEAALRASGLPAVSNVSEKGGSAVASAALNALLYA